MKRAKALIIFLLTLPFLLHGSQVVHADVNDFHVSNYKIDYHLGRGDQNESTLRTVETIVAEFNIPNQNRGIERAIPRFFDNHITDLKVVSIVDDGDRPLEYTTYQKDNNLMVRIGNNNTYVQGSKTYRITYDQINVTRYHQDTEADEFYWNTNGIDWKVPIENLDVSLYVDDSLIDSLSDQTGCYVGSSGSTTECYLMQFEPGSFNVYQSRLLPGENVTIALGFEQDTFSDYKSQQGAGVLFSLWLAFLMFSTLIGAVLIIWIIHRANKLSFRDKDITTIIPEYLAPKGVSVTTAASILPSRRNVLVAQLLDLAIRGYIKIYEVKPKSLLTKAKYDIEIAQDISNLLAEEKWTITDFFGDTTAVGSRVSLKSTSSQTNNSYSFFGNHLKLEKLTRGEYDLKAKDSSASARIKKIGWIVLVASILTLSPFIFAAALVAFFVARFTLWPLSDKGLELRKYLKGLEMYVSVAEVERLKMLQSPEGVMKVGDVDTGDKGKLLLLHERLLPYAIIFGKEKEWGKELASYYESTDGSPSWIMGSSGALNGVAIASVINNLSSSIRVDSTAGGGSTGAGFSGGGGGGGGGGGW